MNLWTHVAGWTLIHFVWQGGLIALATAAALRRCRGRSAEARYAIACAALASMLAAPVATAALLRSPGSALLPAQARVSPPRGPETLLPGPPRSSAAAAAFSAPVAGLPSAVDQRLSWIVWGWLSGVCMLLARLAGGCWRVSRLRRASLTEPVSPWQAVSARLARRLRLRTSFTVLESSLVQTPLVIGWMRPLILIPLGILTNLTTVQVEAILAHELAHIHRRDYAVNLLQTVTEALLFYHPGVWWVSARIRQEREHCCDDVAVAVCGEPAAYAEALAELAAWRTDDPALALGAARGPLLTRVGRLLRVPEAEESRPVGGLVVLSLAILLCGAAAVQSAAGRPRARATGTIAQALPDGWRILKTDHFDIHHPPDLDLHAERAGREAERAYEQVSTDLRHNLGFRPGLVLFRTSRELQEGALPANPTPPHAASFAEPSRDRILLAIDRPVDQWYGLLTHEVAHVFGFDIIPGTATPRWVMEGLAEHQRGTWDPDDLKAMRQAVRASGVPKISALEAVTDVASPRLAHIVGHAAFDFIESRWGKAGMRQFLFQLRQAASGGTDPFAGAFKLTRDQFDQAFRQYLEERFSGSARLSLPERFDYAATEQIEGDITALISSPTAGLACLELLVQSDRGAERRWGVECGDSTPPVMPGLRPGDRVIVTGAPVRRPASQRILMRGLDRPSDGLSWRAQPG